VNNLSREGESLGDKPARQVPAWFPGWARELADLYFSRTTSVFVIHGNVHDLVRSQSEDGAETYCSLDEFLASQLFGSWDVVLQFDVGRGLRANAAGDSDRLRSMAQFLVSRWGEPAGWPRDPEKVLLLLENLLERNLMDEAAARKSIALVFEYAQFLLSDGESDSLARGSAGRLVRFLGWAQNPLLKRVNVAMCLISDSLAEMNDRLVQSPYVASIEVPLPDHEERLAFIRHLSRDQDLAKAADFSAEQLAEMSNGLSLVNLHVVLSQAIHGNRRLDATRFKQLKKSMIERQCQDLIEFVEPNVSLDLLVGQVEAKRRLSDDARFISEGRTEAAPMGYLVCGPVGTGKTFLAECYAGSIGIPCVVLKNFRSKYVGETEGNLQRVLTVLRSLGPVVVIIDEADAALGNREADGDSGTSGRVFSMIASQMGNTRYRGQILWMLLTSRPDLLPIDLKRQGRAEVHIPLFYPRETNEIREMFTVMARKNKVTLAPDAVPAISPDRHLSGADIESMMLSAVRRAMGEARTQLTKEDLAYALTEFIPSAQGLEKELQEIAAVLECTQMSFLPEEWRLKVSQPGGRSALQERMMAIRQLLKD
jgi:SpoVK/Ycf46/Vps4 family AAA+-type ATPase